MDNETVPNSRSVIALYKLDYVDGHYIDQETGENRDSIAAMYSRMKFGSVPDILALAKEMARKYLDYLGDPSSEVARLYSEVSQSGENIVIFAPGYRNVESSSNRLIEVFADLVNIDLAKRGLPTIIVNKLTRTGSNPANYATLSAEERRAISTKTRSVPPGKNLFDMGVHASFGDDIKITGSTVDRLRMESLKAGAKSFSEVYAILLNPEIAIKNPEIEDALNNIVITGELDENIVKIYSHPDFKPVQRMLRLVLGKENREKLTSFFLNPSNATDKALVRLYIAALKNDYAQDPKYKDSVPLLIEVLRQRGLLDANGLPLDPSLV